MSNPNEWRMNAYYYSFERTGIDEIDRILSAVACAGKAFHHTEDWNDEAHERDYLRGKSPRDWIQNAANDAADLIRKRTSSNSCSVSLAS